MFVCQNVTENRNLHLFQILETDIISKKICQKCYKNTQEIYEIRQIALKQDQDLKGKLQECLNDKGIRLPNTCITIKKDNRAPSKPEQQKVVKEATVASEEIKVVKEATVASEEIKDKPQQLKRRKESQSTPTKSSKTIHPSIIDIYRRHPKFKLPKKCIARHMAPIVSLAMEEVETYFRKHKLDMTKYIYNSNVCIIKKKTSLPAKTVSPLKIRKSFQNHEDHDNNYVCSAPSEANNEKIAILKSLALNTPRIHQDAEKKKDTLINQKCLPSPVQSEEETGRRKISGLDNNSSRIAQNKDSEPLKIRIITSPSSSSIPQESSSETSKQNVTHSKEATNKHDETSLGSYQQSNEDLSSKQDAATEFDRLSIPAMSSSITTGSNDKNFKRKTLETNTPDNSHLTSADECVIVDAVAESTEESSSLPNATKPEFIQSLGLTPAVALSQSPHSLECQICSSVQNNMAALKKHSSRHRVCPYCKQKFRTVETKQNHIERNCEVKNIIESPGTFVSLEKADFNPDLRKRYKSTFAAFGLDDVKINDVIVLSDDEELQLNQNNQTPQEINAPLPQEPDDVIDLESSNTPVVSIHNNTILNEIGDNLFEQRLIVELLRVLKKPPRTAEQAFQTVQQRPQDLTINKNDTCRLKNVKGDLLSYMIPVTLTCGEFQVSYKSTTNELKKKSSLAHWTDLPLSLIGKQTPNTSKELSVVNATYPLTFVTSQVQSLSSIQLMTATPTMSIFLPNTSAFIPSTGLSIQPSTVAQTQTINNTFFSPISNTSIQTPLLQNYTLSMTPLPIINNQMSVQTTNMNANKETSPKSSDASTETATSSTSVVASESNDSSSRKSLSSAVKTKKSSAALRRSLAASTKNISKTRSKRKLTNCTSRSSKLRVKNIWELK